MEPGVGVKLLTQQFTAASATAVEIDEDEFVLALGLGHRLVKGSLEPILRRRGRGENEEEKDHGRFFHLGPPEVTLAVIPRGVNPRRVQDFPGFWLNQFFAETQDLKISRRELYID
jgi:hypothetical protein